MILHPHEVSVEDLQAEHVRSPGVHFSDLLKPILRKMDPKRFGGGEIDPEFVFAGFVWEEVMSGALARMARGRRKYLHQMEVVFREVILTIDTFDLEKWRVHEYKFTEMSSRHSILDHRFWHWWVQIKAYCLATGTKEAELWVYFARGDYKGKRREAKRWVAEFSERELEENWMMLENKKKELGTR